MSKNKFGFGSANSQHQEVIYYIILLTLVSFFEEKRSFEVIVADFQFLPSSSVFTYNLEKSTTLSPFEHLLYGQISIVSFYVFFFWEKKYIIKSLIYPVVVHAFYTLSLSTSRLLSLFPPTLKNSLHFAHPWRSSSAKMSNELGNPNASANKLKPIILTGKIVNPPPSTYTFRISTDLPLHQVP